MDAVAAIPVLLAVGGLLALQAAANVQLAGGLGGPVRGSAAQLAIGAVLLLMLVVASGTAGDLGGLGDADAWHLVGGLGSALYITAGIVLFPRLGAVVSVGLLIAGQIAGSAVLDATGALGLEREAPHVAGIAGLIAVLAGTAVVVRAQTGVDAAAARPALVALALVAGAALPAQGAINAQLSADLDAPSAAALWSFAVAAAAMVLVLAAFEARRAGALAPRPARVPWWGWLGGACGAAYVTAVFLAIPELGAAPTVALTVGGQQLASLLVDHRAWLRLPRRPATPARLAGVALLLAGVALAQLA